MDPLKPLNDFLGRFIDQIVNPLVLLMIAVAMVVFVWGVYQFIRNAGDETKRVEGRRAVLWGLVGFVIMFGVYGILNIATATFNLKPVAPISK